MLRRILIWLGALAGACVVLAVVARVTSRTYLIPGDAMSPAISSGDRIGVNRIANALGDIGRGDVIVFVPTPEQNAACGGSPTRYFVKRVIGVTGDRVAVRNGATLVNSRSYVVGGAAAPSYSREFPVVPPRSFLVLGDNRNESCDSAEWFQPFVSDDQVIGAVHFRYWPPRRFRLL